VLLVIVLGRAILVVAFVRCPEFICSELERESLFGLLRCANRNATWLYEKLRRRIIESQSSRQEVYGEKRRCGGAAKFYER